MSKEEFNKALQEYCPSNNNLYLEHLSNEKSKADSIQVNKERKDARVNARKPTFEKFKNYVFEKCIKKSSYDHSGCKVDMKNFPIKNIRVFDILDDFKTEFPDVLTSVSPSEFSTDGYDVRYIHFAKKG